MLRRARLPGPSTEPAECRAPSRRRLGFRRQEMAATFHSIRDQPFTHTCHLLASQCQRQAKDSESDDIMMRGQYLMDRDKQPSFLLLQLMYDQEMNTWTGEACSSWRSRLFSSMSELRPTLSLLLPGPALAAAASARPRPAPARPQPRRPTRTV
jgi:hypothetical protein